LQHVRHGIAFVRQFHFYAAVREDEHINRFGITKQVVHVAEDLLIRADHKETEHRRILWIVLRHRHCRGNTITIDIVVDGTVRVTGNIQQHGASLRNLIQPFQRQYREQLVDPPCVRHRLEQREVDVHFVRHTFLQFVDNRAMCAVLRIQLLLHFVTHAQIKLLSPRAFLQVVSARRIADMNVVQIHLAVV